MDKSLLIAGGNKLCGEITPEASKNSALVCIAAACLATEESTIVLKNIPNTSDTNTMCEIARILGKRVLFEKDVVSISGSISNYVIPSKLTLKLRASLYFIGVLLATTGKIDCGLPGGDKIGPRPIDMHLSAFEMLGAKCQIIEGKVEGSVSKELVGRHIYLKFPSVGATCNIILAATRAIGKTVIINAAREPEIIDLSNLLIKMGIQIIGAGTECITIYGNNVINGNIVHRIIPDRIETGLFAIASAITGGDITIKKCIPFHNFPLISLLVESGVNVFITEDSIRIKSPQIIKPFNANILPFPGIPTDLQPIISILAIVAKGTSTIVDYVFPERFQYISELKRMGADIDHSLNSIRIHGKNTLQGNSVTGNDIRATTALICAGLIAEGTTTIRGLEHLYRGYADLEHKLIDIGANIILQ